MTNYMQRTINRLSVEHDIPLGVSKAICCTAVLTINACAPSKYNGNIVNTDMPTLLAATWSELSASLGLSEEKLCRAAADAVKLITDEIKAGVFAVLEKGRRSTQ